MMVRLCYINGSWITFLALAFILIFAAGVDAQNATGTEESALLIDQAVEIGGREKVE